MYAEYGFSSIPLGGENMNFLFNSDIKNFLLKTKGLMLLSWKALIVDGRMAGDNTEKI